MIYVTEALVFFQALGAIIGVVATVRGELAYVRAMKDGKIDAAEETHLKHVARGLRFGMSLLLVASAGLVVAAFARSLSLQPGLQNAYWTEMILALLIIGLSWALSRKRISFALGSSGIFAGWWFLALLALGQIPAMSFGASIALYVLATALLFAVLWYLRLLLAPKQ